MSLLTRFCIWWLFRRAEKITPNMGLLETEVCQIPVTTEEQRLRDWMAYFHYAATVADYRYMRNQIPEILEYRVPALKVPDGHKVEAFNWKPPAEYVKTLQSFGLAK